MQISCQKCLTVYNISDEKLPSKPKKVKCKKCGDVMTIPPLNQDIESFPFLFEEEVSEKKSEEKKRIPVETDSHILEKLRKYDSRQTDVLCLECGYRGLMGVEKWYATWYLKWWFILLLLLLGILIYPLLVAGIILAVMRLFEGKDNCECICPNCDAKWNYE